MLILPKFFDLNRPLLVQPSSDLIHNHNLENFSAPLITVRLYQKNHTHTKNKQKEKYGTEHWHEYIES